jgi:Mn2+/Fe2+ NRAMP family transporter
MSTDAPQSNPPMVAAADAEALAIEKAELAALEGKPMGERARVYLKKSGPGWLQSAMTLGGGSAMSSLYLGVNFGYKLLWVQPVAMLLGVIMLAAMSHQTLSTGERPFGAMRKHGSAFIAWSWAIATLLSTIIWHFPQYGLAGGMAKDMASAATGRTFAGTDGTVLMMAVGVVVLLFSTWITWNYSKGYRGVRVYEKLLKVLVWLIVVAFAAVVIRCTFSGKIQWGEVAKGLIPMYLPSDGIGVTTVMGAFGAAVGINMTFLYPYTLLARGWGREHRGLAKFDLFTGMLIPYSIATGLIVIAAAATLHPDVLADPTKYGKTISPVAAASMLEAAGMGKAFARYVYGLGIVGMALSTITLHMLVNGFAFCEVFGIEPKGWKYRLACLTPAPGILGILLWSKMGSWIAVPTSAICGVLLPIAYIGFYVMHNRNYLGDDAPRSKAARWYDLLMALSIFVASASAIYYIFVKWDAISAVTRTVIHFLIPGI